MNRIYFINFYYPPLARSRRVYWRARELTDAGWKVTILTIANPSGYFNNFIRDESINIDDPDIEVVRIPVTPWWLTGELLYVAGLLPCPQMNWKRAVEKVLIKRLRREPGVIMSLYFPISSHLAALAAARATGCPLALDFRDEYYEIDTQGWRKWQAARTLRIERELVQEAKYISVTTETVKNNLLRRHGIAPEKIEVILNGFLGELPELAEKDYSGVLNFICAGAITAMQRPQIFREACDLLQNRSPKIAEQIRMVFYGPESRYTGKHFCKYMCPPAITYGGFLGADEARAKILAADAGFMSWSGKQFAYATPDKLFEYVGCGLPVLASVPEGEAANLVRKYNVGIAVEDERPDLLAGALEKLVNERGLLKKFASAAAAAREEFLLKKQISRLSDALREIAIKP